MRRQHEHERATTSTTTTGKESCHVRPYVEPDNQVSALFALNGSVTTMSRLMSAVSPADTPTPDEHEAVLSEAPAAARPNTTSAATAAPANAAPATPHVDAAGTAVTTSTAPRRPARDAEDPGVGERVAGDALHERPGECQRGTGEERGGDPRDAGCRG